MNVSANRKNVPVLVGIQDSQKLVCVVLDPKLLKAKVKIIPEVDMRLGYKFLAEIGVQNLLKPRKH
jgi:hypothetical protein